MFTWQKGFIHSNNCWLSPVRRSWHIFFHSAGVRNEVGSGKPSGLGHKINQTAGWTLSVFWSIVANLRCGYKQWMKRSTEGRTRAPCGRDKLLMNWAESRKVWGSHKGRASSMSMWYVTQVSAAGSKSVPSSTRAASAIRLIILFFLTWATT